MSEWAETGLPCPACGSSDALAVNTDGWSTCFSCNNRFPPVDEDGNPVELEPHEFEGKKALIPMHEMEFRALGKRRLTDATVKKFNYGLAEWSDGDTVQVAVYRDKTGRPVAQKVRFADKEFLILGDMKQAQLFGQHLWRSGGKRVVITEGEIDAMSAAQAMNLSWPVVSVPNGAQSARKALLKEMQWLESFDEIVLCFDQDEQGREAAEECARLFHPGKVKLATLPTKDASDMVQESREKELRDCLWDAREWRPEGIVTAADIVEEARKPVPVGFDWPWESMNKMTHGRRRGEVYAFGAGTGIGKTDLFTQVMAHDLQEGRPVGAIYLEQVPVETMRRVAGKLTGYRFHIPDDGWTQKDLDEAMDTLSSMPFYMYNHFGGTDWDVIKSQIRYLALALDVRDIFLDHLTALASDDDDERKSLDKLMKELAMLAVELNISIYFISHLATPNGTPHEEGGQVSLRHFRGSRAIGFWSHFAFGLERDQQADDEEERHTTTVRCLKDRLSGQGTGRKFGLFYDHETGLLHEVQLDSGFSNETKRPPREDF